MKMQDALKIENPWTLAHQAVELSDHVTLTRILDEGADADEVCCQLTLLRHAIDTEVDATNQSGEPIDSALTAVLLACGADPHLAVNGEAAYDWARELRRDMAIRVMDRFSTRPTKLAARFRRSGAAGETSPGPVPAVAPLRPDADVGSRSLTASPRVLQNQARECSRATPWCVHVLLSSRAFRAPGLPP
ncbi:hypothetical protein [Streptomyces sp. CB02009]|uniref:hypothetical protein n=1 Tax=Streptomyces sp. CB02009 TaxID=1703938 RepID=UPI0009390E78|nr:hypothetical protein [Streptomyces sp. CB02009]